MQHHSFKNDRGTVDLSRRELMRGLAALGAGSLLPFGNMSGQGNSASRVRSGRIDVHHHFLPPFYVKEMEQEMKATGFTARPWTPEVSLEAMDKHNIATSMISPIQRVVLDSMSDRSERARSLVRKSNEYGAQVVKDHPGRFGLFASLPLPDTDGSLKEIAYAYDVLKVDGIALWTSYLDKWPGDPMFAPVFEELNRRKAVVFYHPAAASCCRNLIPGLSISGIIEYDLDTARCAESMLINGTPSRFPEVRFIFSHSGGALPVLAPRIIDDYPKNRMELVPHGVEYEFKKFYYEVAHGSGTPSLAALKELAPVSQVLFGSDATIRPYELTLEGLERFKGYSGTDMAAINRGNAERLFPRLKT